MTIQLTNPNILDLTEWQKVINEINQLSARIDAITTSQGALTTGAVDWNAGPTFSQQFNIGTQKILFGREKFVVASESPNGSFYTGTVNFSETTGVGSFKAKPIVTTTIASTSNVMLTSNANIVMTIFNTTSTGFSYRLTNAGTQTSLSGQFYINWIAIGPQG